MSTASTVPAALDALVAAAQRAAATVEAATGEPVSVVDSAGVASAKTQLIIGYAAGSASDAVEDTQTLAGITIGRDMENYSVACQASTWAGNGGFSAPRRLAYAVVDAFSDELSADKTLGRVVMQARIAEAPYMPTLPEKGPTVTVPFRVQIEARRAAK